MRVTIAVCAVLLCAVACSSNKPAASSGGSSFTLTGAVRTVTPGDKPPTTPKGVTGIAGSMTVQADAAPSGCDNPTKVFFTSSTQGSGSSGSLMDKRVDITGTQYSNCTFVADSIATVTSGGGSSGAGSSSPGTLPSASPKVTKGPAPEGAIYDQTPSVPPATQK